MTNNRPGSLPFYFGLVPPEWFRYNRVAKGNPTVTLVLSFVVFAAAVVTFGFLANAGARNSVTESVISTSDKTGVNGWTCEMV